MYNSVHALPARTAHRPKPRIIILSSMYNHGVGLRTRSQSLPFRSLPQKEDSDFTPLLSGVYRNLCAAVQYAASNVATWVGPAGSEYLDASVADILRPIRCRSVTIIRPFIVDFIDDVVRGVLCRPWSVRSTRLRRRRVPTPRTHVAALVSLITTSAGSRLPGPTALTTCRM